MYSNVITGPSNNYFPTATTPLTSETILARLKRDLSNQLEVAFDTSTQTLWSYLHADGVPWFSPGLLKEIDNLHLQVESKERFHDCRYHVIGSKTPGIFSLGGDLASFLSWIRSGDEASLRRYATTAIDQVWHCVSGHGADIHAIALLEGEAQGGGFEAALACRTLVAEKGTKCGFPESLFGLFPGMGARALLAARIGEDVATRIIASSERFTADFLHEIGIVDVLVDKGQGSATIMDMITNGSLAKTCCDFSQIGRNDLYGELDLWVKQALSLPESKLRAMGYLVAARTKLMRRRLESSINFRPNHPSPGGYTGHQNSTVRQPRIN